MGEIISYKFVMAASDRVTQQQRKTDMLLGDKQEPVVANTNGQLSSGSTSSYSYSCFAFDKRRARNIAVSNKTANIKTSNDGCC